MESLDELNGKIDALMKKYKLTMYGMIACIAVYLVCLFWVKNIWILLAVCVPMIVLAVLNNRLAKQLRTLIAERNKRKAKEEAAARAVQNGENVEDLAVGDENLNEAVIANAKSLNELPKEYTVLDKVDLNGEELDHMVLSPYGIAIVAGRDRTDEVQALLEELELESPVYYYAPTDDIALLAEEIQLPKEVALTEPDIYKVLYKMTGLQ